MHVSDIMSRSPSNEPVRFPPGQTLLRPVPFQDDALSLVDDRLAMGDCGEGRFEITTRESRLTCLIHHSAPYLAGLQEGHLFTQVPLYDFVTRSRQLEGAMCSLVKTDSPLVLLTAVHFCKRPMLQGSTRLVDPAHVLAVLARERRDAAIAFERSGSRTLLFLKDGEPARLYFGDRQDDPGAGSLEERVLAFAFAPDTEPCRVEVFTELQLEPDPDARTSLVKLAQSSQPAPPVDICVHYPDGRELRRRPYAGPEMIIGRDPTVDLYIDNLAVSRKHARITWQRGGFVLEDLGSANGTFIDGEPVTSVVLSAGQEVEIGKFRLSIYEYPIEPQVMETMFMPLKATPSLGYLIGAEETVRLRKDTIFGKGDGVDVRVAGFRVQPVHARLSFQDGEFELRCFGKGKLRVNGDTTRAATLTFGDEIQIGRTRFQLAREAGSSTA